jgi:predicted kinase
VPGGVTTIPAGLIVLIGPPGAGKSSFADALVEAGSVDPDDVVSSDSIAEMLFGPDYDSSRDPEIFGERNRRVREQLAAGRPVVADSTNVTRAARLGLLSLSRAAGRPATAIRFVLPLEAVLEQAGRRAKRVAEISWFHEQMVESCSVEALLDEGFDVVVDAPTAESGASPEQAARAFRIASSNSSSETSS